MSREIREIPPDRSRTSLMIFLCALGAFLADFVSKSWAAGLPGPLEAGHLALAHVQNSGLIFSSFGDGGISTEALIFARLVLVGVCALVAARAVRLPAHERLGVALIAAGGLGNVADLVVRGDAVVDFIGINPLAIVSGYDGFHVFFNLADVFILVGVALALPAIRILALAIQRRLVAWRLLPLARDASASPSVGP